MFNKKANKDFDFASEMQKNLIQNSKDRKVFAFNKLEKAAELLSNASEIFDEIGLDKYSEAVIGLLSSIAKADMSEDEMVKNLEEHGWMFKTPGKNEEANPQAVKVKIDLKKHKECSECGDMSYACDHKLKAKAETEHDGLSYDDHYPDNEKDYPYAILEFASDQDFEKGEVIKGTNYKTKEYALKVLNEGKFDSGIKYIELDGPDVYEKRRNNNYKKNRLDSGDRERAMQAGMMGGTSAYNEELGYDVGDMEDEEKFASVQKHYKSAQQGIAYKKDMFGNDVEITQEEANRIWQDAQKQTSQQTVKLVYNPKTEAAQQALKQLGFKGKDGKLLGVDGKRGDNTIFALKNFEKEYKKDLHIPEGTTLEGLEENAIYAYKNKIESQQTQQMAKKVDQFGF